MVKNKNLKELFDNLTDKIKREYKPEKIILFGSFAWGKPDRHSDIDLFIIKRTDKRHIDRSVEVAKILDEENEKFALEILVYTPKEVSYRLKLGDPFIKKIINKGDVLYG